MQYVGSALFLSLFWLSAASAGDVKIWSPPDEHLDPATTWSVDVRPGQTVSLAADVFEADPRGGFTQKNLQPSDFRWIAGCDATSPGCPKATVGTGILVTFNIPLCMPMGPLTVNVSQGGLKPAVLTLNNIEEPSKCKESDYDMPYDEGEGEGFEGGPRSPSGEFGERSSRNGLRNGISTGGAGGRFSSGRSAGRSGKRNGFESGWSGGGFGGGGGSSGNYQPYHASAEVVECAYFRGKTLECRRVELGQRRAYVQIQAKAPLRVKAPSPVRVKPVVKSTKAKPRQLIKAKARDLRVVNR